MANLSQIYDVDLKLLRCFCAIVEEGSFTAAQATLNLSQSVLSEYLKSLEIRLGTRLCQRGPKGFKLFPEGEVVYRAAKDLFASVETFKQRASHINEGTSYELVIGIQDAIVENPQSRISQAIERFSAYYPNVRFKVEIMLGFQMMGRVADGVVHVGIGLVNDQFQQLSVERLFDEEAWICCGASHPLFGLPDEDITRERIETAAYCNRGHLEYFHPERTRHLATRGDIGLGAHAQLALILSGRNIGYVPEFMVKPYLQSGQLRILRPDLTRIVNPIAAMSRTSATELKLARRFIDSLVDTHMEATPQQTLPEPPAYSKRPGRIPPLTRPFEVVKSSAGVGGRLLHELGEGIHAGAMRKPA